MLKETFVQNIEKIKITFFISSMLLFIGFLMVDGIATYDVVTKSIFSKKLRGDEHTFIDNLNFKIIDFRPWTIGMTSNFIDLFINDGRLSLRFVSLFFTLSTLIYLIFNSRKLYIFSILTFCLVFLKNYPILYSATDDSTLMFFLVLGIHQFFIRDNLNIGSIGLLLAIITKDVGLIYAIALLAIILLQSFINIKIKKHYIVKLLIAILITTIGGYKIFWKDKGANQAPGYPNGVSWFNVRAVSAIAKSKREFNGHRINPEEYLMIVNKLNLTVPNNNADFIKNYPSEWIEDKFVKFFSLMTPHKVFGMSILGVFLSTLFVGVHKNLKLNKWFVFNIFLVLSIIGIILSVNGYFERRWILSVEILFLLSLAGCERKPYLIYGKSNYRDVLYFIMFATMIYMNRNLFFNGN